jgi:hypothetical protein
VAFDAGAARVISGGWSAGLHGSPIRRLDHHGALIGSFPLGRPVSPPVLPHASCGDLPSCPRRPLPANRTRRGFGIEGGRRKSSRAPTGN